MRNPALPDVPTMAEAGFTGAEAMAWGGLLAPAATPDSIIRVLNAAIVKTLGRPAVRDRINRTGLETISSSPEQMKAEIAKETKIWERVVNEAKIAGK